MKSYHQLTAKMHRAAMRESALRFRQFIHPHHFSYGTKDRFVFSTEMATQCLVNAIGYRDMAKECVS